MKDKSLGAYLDIASNAFVEAKVHLGPSLNHLNDIDDLYNSLFEEMGSYIKPAIAAVLILNGHACLRSAISLALGGQIIPVFMSLRGTLESMMYANAIVANPDLGDVWLHRDKDKAAREKCKDEFAIWKMFKFLKETLNPDFSEGIRDIYDSTIDFGAHPNSKSLLSSLRLDSEASDSHHHLDLAYIHGHTSFQTRQALVACADVGAQAFYIALACNKDHRQMTELNDRVLYMEKNTPEFVKELGMSLSE